MEPGIVQVISMKGEAAYTDRVANPFPQLLLLDLRMPRLDGFDVLRWMRNQESLKRLLAVVLTTSGLKDDVNRAYDLGANSYLVKPMSMDEFVVLVDKLHDYWLRANQCPDCTV